MDYNRNSERSMKNIIFVVLYLLTSCNCSSDNIIWEIQRLPITFGENAELLCHPLGVEQCCGHKTTWMKDSDVIVHHGSSSNISKYQEREDVGGFILTIEDFNIDDVNCEYSCLYEFYTYSRRLEFVEDQFIQLPSSSFISTNKTYEDVLININFRHVLPVPKCRLLLDGHDETSNVSSSKTKQNIFYDVSITLSHKINHNQYNRNLLVSCSVGERTILMETVQVYTESNVSPTCQGEIDSSKSILIGICIGIACTLFMFVGWFLARRRFHSKQADGLTCACYDRISKAHGDRSSFKGSCLCDFLCKNENINRGAIKASFRTHIAKNPSAQHEEVETFLNCAPKQNGIKDSKCVV